MSIYRLLIVGSFVCLGACTASAPRPYVPPPLPVATTPEPIPPPMAIAPTTEPEPTPVTAVAPVEEGSSEPLENPQAATTSAAPVLSTTEASTTEASATAASLNERAPDPALSSPLTVTPAKAPMEPGAAQASKAGVDSAEKALPSRVLLQGKVSLEGSSGQTVAAGDVADTLVYYVPAAGGARVKPGRFTVYTHNRDFNPEAISVPQGSTVTFVNLDDVRHNVFSVTPGADFNLGYQASGEKASHAFARAGVVLVSCNVHRSMELDMLVVPTPYSVKVDADGSFSLKDLPAGSGKLYFWNPRAPLSSQSVTLPTGTSIKQKLVATKPSRTTQLNLSTRP